MITPSPDALVVRSNVPQEGEYGKYLTSLRFDFFYACAYCFMAEREAHGISFAIDHYLPKSRRPDIELDYENLMYSCTVCNRYKLDKFPADHDQVNGYRFFRTDVDFFGDHYTVSGLRLEPKTSVGEYTIEICFLNRGSLRRLRDMRRRVADCDEHSSVGALWLKNFRIDRLPPTMRVKGMEMIAEATAQGEDIKSSDDLVRWVNRSFLLELEETAEIKERKRRLKLLKERMRT